MTNNRDRVEYETADGVRVVLSGAQFECTRCFRTLPGSEFGLREMGDGIVRNQAQCTTCRGLAAKWARDSK